MGSTEAGTNIMAQVCFFAAFDVDFCVSMFTEHLFQGTSQL